MDENDAVKRGFNHGYLLEKYHPKLAQQLEEGLTNRDDPYAQGFFKGRQVGLHDSFFDEAAPQDFSHEPGIEKPGNEQESVRDDKNQDSGLER